jgi:hypothetical protein
MYFIIPLCFDDFLQPPRARWIWWKETEARWERGREGGRAPMLARATDYCRRLKEGVGPRAAGWSLRGPLIVDASRKAVGQRAAAKWRLETKCCEWKWFLGKLCS